MDPAQAPAAADWRRYHEIYAKDGVVRLPGVFGSAAMAIFEAAFDWILEAAGDNVTRFFPDTSATFVEARSQSPDEPRIRRIFDETPVGEIVAGLFGSGPVWFHGEQSFMKDARGADIPARRTPWHQDAGYDPFQGPKIATVWINLDPVPPEGALEVAKGTHHGPLFNPTTFILEDETAPLFVDCDRPVLPNIEADRASYDIVSWAAEPGDALIFHSKTLHGGAPAQPGRLRRSLTLRLIGDDVVKTVVPTERSVALQPPTLFGVHDLRPGQPYHACGLAKVHPGW